MLKHRVLAFALTLCLLAGLAGNASAAVPAWELEETPETSGLPDPLVAYMLDQVTTEKVMNYNRALAGEIPVWVDDDWYTITSRYTYAGESMQKTTDYIGQHLQALGLDVEYHIWENETNPNVIGEIPGLFDPQQIFIIGGHLDDVQGTPGADDNASGSVATLVAADILSQFNWGCTLRFAFWTGEEEGLLGSSAYAERAYQNGENILGYLNLDMIAWNTPDSSPDIDLIYNPLIPSSQTMAQLFADVVAGYQLDLVPELVDDPWGGSDHLPFWDYGFPAILAIEDNSDFNPYYHEAGDTPDHLDPVYFNNFAKAALGTIAHMSGCLIPRGLGSLSGQVTSSSTGDPIEGAGIHLEGSLGHTFDFQTDAQGFYSSTLIADTYTVTASLYGYLPESLDGVQVITDTNTTVDFSLQLAPIYTISGTVGEIQTGAPLLAQVLVDGTPVSTWTDPASGDYQIELPQGNYTLTVDADHYKYQQRWLDVDQSQIQDFSLELQGCLLLVDDDQDAPDVSGSYTGSLELLDVSYDIWDTELQGNPPVQELSGYPAVVWFTGATRSGTLHTTDESNLASYLDGGGHLFLSSQDYLFDKGLTAFGSSYLHIADYVSNVGQLDVVGLNVYEDLGPYHLFFPYTDYADMLIPDTEAQVAFAGNYTIAAISYSGASFKTVFLSFPFEAIGEAADPQTPLDRAAILGRTLEFFGGCQDPRLLADTSPIDVVLEQGGTLSTSSLLRNTGMGSLTYTLTTSQPVSWLEILPDSGSILPSSSQVISLTVDVSNLPVGTYTTMLAISTNDSQNPNVFIPINLTVTSHVYITKLPMLIKT